MPKKLTTDEFIAKAKIIHGDKYDYSQTLYVDKNTSVIIICQRHGKFTQTPHHHLHRKQGCPICARRISALKKAKPKDIFLEQAQSIHGTRYDYSQIEYINSNTPITIICKEHGAFTQTPYNHINSLNGCPKCAIKARNKSLQRTFSDFIQKARDIHGSKYDYSLAKNVSNKSYIEIICPEHGIFTQNVATHLSGHGCPKCAGKAVKNTPLFIKEAQHRHGDKYDYSLTEYTNLKEKVLIICKTHGAFTQSAGSHLTGRGCPICGKFRRRRKHFNVGIYDTNESNIHEQSYKIWHGMMLRCYSTTCRDKFPAYKDVIVCNEWHNYSVFKTWFDANYINGYDLDKDILIRNSKIYSPDTCCFVPHEINAMLTKNDAKRGDLPIGVRKFGNRYTARCSTRNGRKWLGSYITSKEAFNAYKYAKECYIKEIATDYYSRSKISKQVFDALMKYEVNITD